jgi:hypothetical protein
MLSTGVLIYLGIKAICDFTKEISEKSPIDKKTIEKVSSIQNDISKTSSIASKMKKGGDGFEILQDSIGF